MIPQGTPISVAMTRIHAGVSVPASAVCAVLAEPIIRLLYQRGDFKANQTPVVAACLAAFAAGLMFNGAMLMLNRAFFSLQSNWVPTWIALGNLFLNAVLDLALYHVGAWGIDACYSCTQKCLGGPSGLAPVIFSPRALKQRVKCRSFYFDLQLLDDFWLKRKYHHTMSSTLVYALYEALAIVESLRGHVLRGR